MLHQALTETQLRHSVPSAFAAQPWERMSAKYRMIPTIEVVRHLQQHGFVPMRAAQARTRIPGKADFTRHVIRFRNPDVAPLAVGDVVPELVLSNSHDGTSAYKIMLGMFRLACSNGLMVHSGTVNEISVRHSGSDSLANEVLDASFEVIEQAPNAIAQIADWSKRRLAHDQRMAYATAALELRDTTLKPEPQELLHTRRAADRSSDIFTTFNVVQENLIRGGQHTLNARGRRSTVRAVKSVNENIKLNRALWRLTEELAAKVA